MIYLYSGTPGSGKSLHTAKVLYQRLRKGQPVIANFPVNIDKISRKNIKFIECNNYELTPNFLIAYSHEYFSDSPVKEGKLLLVIDECQLMFNAREWNVRGRSDWLSFFTQHRKYGYDIILIAQFDRMIDRQIRSLIEYEYIHRKVSNYGTRGHILSMCMGGHMFVAVKMWYPLKLRIGSEFFRARKKYYSLYDTFGMFGSSAVGTEGSPRALEVDISSEQIS